MGQRRFMRLTNGFSKKLDNHVAAVALHVAHYNLCRIHEALKMTPAKALARRRGSDLGHRRTYRRSAGNAVNYA
jgi:hypothetical protein